MTTNSILDNLANEQASYQSYLDRGTQAIDNFDLEKTQHDAMDLAYKQGRGLAKQLANQALGESTVSTIEGVAMGIPHLRAVGSAIGKHIEANKAVSNYENLTGKKFNKQQAIANRTARGQKTEAGAPNEEPTSGPTDSTSGYSGDSERSSNVLDDVESDTVSQQPREEPFTQDIIDRVAEANRMGPEAIAAQNRQDAEFARNFSNLEESAVNDAPSRQDAAAGPSRSGVSTEIQDTQEVREAMGGEGQFAADARPEFEQTTSFSRPAEAPSSSFEFQDRPAPTRGQGSAFEFQDRDVASQEVPDTRELSNRLTNLSEDRVGLTEYAEQFDEFGLPKSASGGFQQLELGSKLKAGAGYDSNNPYYASSNLDRQSLFQGETYEDPFSLPTGRARSITLSRQQAPAPPETDSSATSTTGTTSSGAGGEDSVSQQLSTFDAESSDVSRGSNAPANAPLPSNNIKTKLSPTSEEEGAGFGEGVAEEEAALGATEAAEASIPGVGEILMGITALAGAAYGGYEGVEQANKAKEAQNIKAPAPMPQAPTMQAMAFSSAPVIDSAAFHSL